MLNNPSSGHDPGLPAVARHDLTTFEGRIAAACDWLDLEPPVLTYDEEDPRGGAILDDDILQWMLDTGVSLDWLVAGDPKVMVAEARARRLDERRFSEALNRFDDAELRLLVDAVRTSKEEGVPFEEALEGWTKGVEAYRAAKAGEARLKPDGGSNGGTAPAAS